MKLGLVTDSTCDLPEFIVQEHRIEVVPLALIVDGVEYADGRGLSRDDFYVKLASPEHSASTAAPSVADMAERYEGLLRSGSEHVLSMHAASALTAVVNSAVQAAGEFGDRVTVVDSLSLTLGLGFQVLAAAEAADDGLEAALDAAAEVRSRLRIFAALDTIKYVHRSGRLSNAAALVGGLLSVKPLVELTGGLVKTAGAVRTAGQANERLLQLAAESGAMDRFALLHTAAEDRARLFLSRLMQESRQSIPRNILMVNVTPVIGAHAGPNAIGFVALTSAPG